MQLTFSENESLKSKTGMDTLPGKGGWDLWNSRWHLGPFFNQAELSRQFDLYTFFYKNQ